jgi:uncharacterized damage-inducible protein DinB
MSTQTMNFVHFFDYLLIARTRLLEWVRTQSSTEYTRSFAIGLGSMRATLLHMAATEWGYARRLRGVDYGPGDNPFTVERYPEYEAFAAAWDRQAPVTREALTNVGDPARPVEYVSRSFTPPMRTRTTAGGIAGQLLFHEVHHRAQVMAMLRQVGVAAENLDYSRLMWERTPITCGSSPAI